MPALGRRPLDPAATVTTLAHAETAPGRRGASMGQAILARLPLVVWLMIVALSVAELWMIAVTINRPTPELWGVRGWESLMGLAFGGVGFLIARRRPENRIGWLILGIALASLITGAIDQYPVLSDSGASALPFSEVSRWLSSWAWIVGACGLVSLMPLLFPDGHLLSARWRAAVVLALVAAGTLIASIVLVVQPLGPLRPSAVAPILYGRVTPLLIIGFALYIASAMLAAASLIVRYRRVTTEQRQQIKWVAFAGMLVVPAAAAGFSQLLIGQLLLLLAVGFAAAALAIAILRYRLYEIDLIINRTLVYGALSAILAGVYTASITLSQRVFTAVTGERSDAAIVLTTLIVAATFTPLKTRLQAVVDARLKTAQPLAAASTPASALDLLVRLDQLRATGVISSADYDTAKAGLLRLAVQPSPK